MLVSRDRNSYQRQEFQPSTLPREVLYQHVTNTTIMWDFTSMLSFKQPFFGVPRWMWGCAIDCFTLLHIHVYWQLTIQVSTIWASEHHPFSIRLSTIVN
jgi:hypothetical protein